MGFVLLGIATLTATGIQAALIGNVAHGVITGLLFFLAGAIKDRCAHRRPRRAGRAAGDRAPAGRAARLRRDRVARPARAGRLLGRGVRGGRRRRRRRPALDHPGVLAAVGGALTAAYFLRLLRQVTHGPAAPGASAGVGPGAGRCGAGRLGAAGRCSRWPSGWPRRWCSASPRPRSTPCAGPVAARAVSARDARAIDHVALLPALPGRRHRRARAARRPARAPGRRGHGRRGRARRARPPRSAPRWSARGGRRGDVLRRPAGCSLRRRRPRPRWSRVRVRAARRSACSALSVPAAAGRAVAGRGVLLPAGLLDDRRRGARRGRRPDHADRGAGDADPAAVRAGRPAPARALARRRGGGDVLRGQRGRRPR